MSLPLHRQLLCPERSWSRAPDEGTGLRRRRDPHDAPKAFASEAGPRVANDIYGSHGAAAFGGVVIVEGEVKDEGDELERERLDRRHRAGESRGRR